MRLHHACVLLIVVLCARLPSAKAQFPLGGSASTPAGNPDPAVLFRNQCGTCHVVEANSPARQGPNLAGIYQRRAGSVAGFKYSAAFAKADFEWDDAHLDAWLTNPQAALPGSVMLYRQANPTTRKVIIDWLKEQH